MLMRSFKKIILWFWAAVPVLLLPSAVVLAKNASESGDVISRLISGGSMPSGVEATPTEIDLAIAAIRITLDSPEAPNLDSNEEDLREQIASLEQLKATMSEAIGQAIEGVDHFGPLMIQNKNTADAEIKVLTEGESGESRNVSHAIRASDSRR